MSFPALLSNPANPRWFADQSGRGVLLTGFHTWNNLVDMRPGEEPNPFDFELYLDTLESLGHNFIRLWAWDALCTWNPSDRVDQFPWPRTGPGLAVDGKPKFDLDRFDESFFERLESRVRAAGERGIFVGVMLLEGWVANTESTTPHDWHVFAAGNNINGIDVNATTADGWMLGWMGLADPAVTAVQDRYVAEVARRLNGFPHVMYEVANEAGPLSYPWQEHVMATLRSAEAGLPHQHLIGVCGGWGMRDARMFQTTADYAAPEGWTPEGEASRYRDGFATWGEAPETARVPIILDTDHIWGIGGNVRWAWQSFLRGYHPVYMDRIDDLPGRIFEHPWWPDPTNLELRHELGAIGRLARELDLNKMRPQNDLSSSGYCLAGPDELLALSLDGASLELQVGSGWSGEWVQTLTGARAAAILAEGSAPCPFATDSILVLRRS